MISGFKETSFLYAISSASLVHTFARACSRGSIDRCTCDESKNLQNREAWLWGGCGDNVRFGLKFSRRFLRAGKRRSKDIRARVDQHNIRLGRKVSVSYPVRIKCFNIRNLLSSALPLRRFQALIGLSYRKWDNLLPSVLLAICILFKRFELRTSRLWDGCF